MSRPKTIDQKMEFMMPRGTLMRAFTVSSEVWAEPSNPVMV